MRRRRRESLNLLLGVRFGSRVGRSGIPKADLERRVTSNTFIIPLRKLIAWRKWGGGRFC